ncbi:hypothetical protein GCM10009592_14390 [Brachybacterium rhamnosum]
MRPRDLVDTEVAGLACGRSSWTVRKAVRDGLLVNYGRGRGYRVSLAQVIDVLGDPLCIG